ncbi:MAG: endonuclease/exonuclease/phosphatase family protein [Erysipelotrichaceae bacterium]
MNLRIMSYNIKRDFLYPRAKHRWDYRQAKVAKLIADSQCHIVGVQELLPTMKQDLSALLPDYKFLGKGRWHSLKPHDDEHAAILVSNETTKVLHTHTFWLSRYPNKIASRFITAMFPRICTLATIEHNNQKIRVLNTHLDHISFFARNASVELIIETVQTLNAIEELPTIVMGDFNTKINSKCIQRLGTILQDVYHCEQVELTNTLHHYTGKQKPNKSPIDFIFVSDHFEVEKVSIVTQKVDGIYPSDHFPVITDLKLKESYALG